MQIIKKDSFRSQGSTVDKTDDMYRVVVDMKRTEYPQFTKLMEDQKPSTNKQNKAVTIGCTCGKRMSTVHLCDECFRDAVTA